MIRIVAAHGQLMVQNEVLRERLEGGRSPKTEEFIALYDEAEVGLLIYEDWGLPSSFIYEIFVIHEARNNGIATLLLAHAEMIAAQLGRNSIRLIARSLCLRSLSHVELSAWYARKGYVECVSEEGQLEKFLN